MQILRTILISMGILGALMAPAGGQNNAKCLECHGPFDKLVSSPASFALLTGDKINPHRYVPHKSKDAPECTGCHQEHPVPLEAKENLKKPDIGWCYEKCHHQQDFTPCAQCHPDKG